MAISQYFFLIISTVQLHCDLIAGSGCSKMDYKTFHKTKNVFNVSIDDLRHRIKVKGHIRSLIATFNEQLNRELLHVQPTKKEAGIASKRTITSEQLEQRLIAATTNANCASIELQALLFRGADIHTHKAHEAFIHAAMHGYYAIIHQLLSFSQQTQLYSRNFIEEIIAKLNNAYFQFQSSEIQQAQDVVTLLLWEYLQGCPFRSN